MDRLWGDSFISLQDCPTVLWLSKVQDVAGFTKITGSAISKIFTYGFPLRGRSGDLMYLLLMYLLDDRASGKSAGGLLSECASIILCLVFLIFGHIFTRSFKI